MINKIYKLFLKIAPSFKLILINIFFVYICFYSESAFSEITNIERNLAYKYCDSIEKNLFRGLDSEKILKYEYFFNSINKEAINDGLKDLSGFYLEVEKLCSYKLKFEEIEDIKKMLKILDVTTTK